MDEYIEKVEFVNFKEKSGHILLKAYKFFAYKMENGERKPFGLVPHLLRLFLHRIKHLGLFFWRELVPM